jgi:hypothetical protein
MGLRKLDYWCWLVIHIIPLHRLFIQIFNPNGILYFMSHPPTQPQCIVHQQFILLSIAHILQYAFLHFQDSKRKWDLPIYLLFLSFSYSSYIVKSTFYSTSKIFIILWLFFMIWGFISLHTLEHHIIACLTRVNWDWKLWEPFVIRRFLILSTFNPMIPMRDLGLV